MIPLAKIFSPFPLRFLFYFCKVETRTVKPSFKTADKFILILLIICIAVGIFLKVTTLTVDTDNYIPKCQNTDSEDTSIVFYIHLSYSFNFIDACQAISMRGIPLPSRVIVVKTGEPRIFESKCCKMCKKPRKRRFWLEFGECSTHTLVKIYNNGLLDL